MTTSHEQQLTAAISAAMVDLYAAFYEHDRTTATTYINDKIVVCVLENILTESEDALVADGARGEVIDGRVAFQTDTEDEFTAPDPLPGGSVYERQPDRPRRRLRAFLPRLVSTHDTCQKRGAMSLDCARTRSDGELMTRASAGSVDAFAQLYHRYGDRAYRVARSVCRDDERAQDAVHDAFLSVWQSRSSYRTQRGTVPAWLLTVVRYRAIDLERQNRKHASDRADPELREGVPANDNVSDQAVKRAEAERLRATLARLPDAQQEVITLAFYGELTHTEIATHLGLPAGTVKGRMRLGLQSCEPAWTTPSPDTAPAQHGLRVNLTRRWGQRFEASERSGECGGPGPGSLEA